MTDRELHENPYEAPTAYIAGALPLWRYLAGFAFRVASVLSGLLAVAMILGGANWLRIEFNREGPLSLSLALLGGGSIFAWVSVGLAWLAKRVGGPGSALAWIAVGILSALVVAMLFIAA